MNSEVNNSATDQLLTELYKNMKMGADGIINVTPKVKGGPFRDELLRELDTYEKYSKKISKLILDMGGSPKEENIFSKVASKIGTEMNTLTDSTESHIAQMMIEGATMGITENTKLKLTKRDLTTLEKYNLLDLYYSIINNCSNRLLQVFNKYYVGIDLEHE